MGAVNSSADDAQDSQDRRFPPFSPAAYPGSLHASYQSPADVKVVSPPTSSASAALPTSPPGSPGPPQPSGHTGAGPIPTSLPAATRAAPPAGGQAQSGGMVYGAAYPPEMAAIVLQIEQQVASRAAQRSAAQVLDPRRITR